MADPLIAKRPLLFQRRSYLLLRQSAVPVKEKVALDWRYINGRFICGEQEALFHCAIRSPIDELRRIVALEPGGVPTVVEE